jgi:fructose transport system substrate-binding protein
MQRRTASRRFGLIPLALFSVTALGLSACGGGSESGAPAGQGGGGTDEAVAVTLITKTSTNPFFIAMQKGAEEAGKDNNVTITTAAGKEDGDETTQISAIEAAIARGDKGILITPATDGVNPAIEQARAAGLYVIALDTPPNPPSTVDITFATDNFKAGELVGKWTAGTLDGKKATIALLDLFNDKVASVDYNRDQGFLTGMGIDTKDKTKNGDEDRTGRYTGGKGGEYEIVCNEPTNGCRTKARRPWRTAWPRRRTSTSSTPSTSPPPPGPLRRCRTRGSRTRSSCPSTVAATRVSARSRAASSEPPPSSTR